MGFPEIRMRRLRTSATMRSGLRPLKVVIPSMDGGLPPRDRLRHPPKLASPRTHHRSSWGVGTLTMFRERTRRNGFPTAPCPCHDADAENQCQP